MGVRALPALYGNYAHVVNLKHANLMASSNVNHALQTHSIKKKAWCGCVFRFDNIHAKGRATVWLPR